MALAQEGHESVHLRGGWDAGEPKFIDFKSKWRFFQREPTGAVAVTLVAWVQDDHESVRNEMGKEAGRAKKLEDRINVLLKGYQMRSGKLEELLLAAQREVEEASRELKSFTALKEQVCNVLGPTHQSPKRPPSSDKAVKARKAMRPVTDMLVWDLPIFKAIHHNNS